MTPITWLSCFTILWTIVADTQADIGDPLVVAFYNEKYKNRPTFADLSDVTDENFKLPLHDAKPEYFALLCGETDGHLDKHSNLIVQWVTEKIDSEAKKIKCTHHPLPTLRLWGTMYNYKLYDIGYNLLVPENSLKPWRQQENKSTTTSELFDAFEKKFSTPSWPKYNIEFLDIRYHLKYDVPLSISHIVKAQMHSNKNEEQCKNLIFNTFDISNSTYETHQSDTHEPIQDPDYQWRQLVPIQDFKGTYATKATCIHLNYVLLHKKAIESLEKIENFIRDVADVIGEVNVGSGTYTPDKDALIQGNKPNQTIIPLIVWKKISHEVDWLSYYTVLVVINNKKTERICEHNKDTEKLGLPEYDYEKSEIDIGDMYYCLYDEKMKKLLTPEFNGNHKLFNFNKLSFKEGDETKEINVIEKIRENKQARSNDKEEKR